MNLHPLIRGPYLDDPDVPDEERARRIAVQAYVLQQGVPFPKRLTPRVKALFRELGHLRDAMGEDRWTMAAEEARREYDIEKKLAKADAEFLYNNKSERDK